MVDAMRIVVDRSPDAHLLLMGYPNEERYRRLVRARGLSRSVTVTGRIDYRHAPSRLNLGEIAVGPKRSLSEANGKLLNYMACGLPTVATDTPVNRDILGDAESTARLVTPARWPTVCCNYCPTVPQRPRGARPCGAVPRGSTLGPY